MIGNGFGAVDRYLWPTDKIAQELRESLGISTSKPRTGKVTVKFRGWWTRMPDLAMDDAWYVEPTGELASGTDVLADMEVNGRTQPAIVRKTLGKGTLYYLLFDPYFPVFDPYFRKWGEKPSELNRTSLPVLHFLFKKMGLKHDTHFGNVGFDLKNGRISVHEEPVHHFVSKDVDRFGTYADEFGEDRERYSGGVITSDFLSFRGQSLNERDWTVEASAISSIFAAPEDGAIGCFTSDPVNLIILRDGSKVEQRTEPYKTYHLPTK